MLNMFDLMHDLKNAFDKISEPGNLITYPLIVQEKATGLFYLLFFSVREKDELNTTRPLFYGLTTMDGEIIETKPCVENDFFFDSFDTKKNAVNLKQTSPHSVYVLFSMLLYRFKTTSLIDKTLYQAYLTEVNNTMGMGLQNLYEELQINEQYQKI